MSSRTARATRVARVMEAKASSTAGSMVGNFMVGSAGDGGSRVGSSMDSGSRWGERKMVTSWKWSSRPASAASVSWFLRWYT